MPGLVRCACAEVGQGAFKSLQRVHRMMPTRIAVATIKTQLTVSSLPVMSQDLLCTLQRGALKREAGNYQLHLSDIGLRFG
jgi:hypothetical protein